MAAYKKLIEEFYGPIQQQKFQIRHGIDDSIMFPGKFSLGSYKQLLDLIIPETYPQSLSWNAVSCYTF